MSWRNRLMYIAAIVVPLLFLVALLWLFATVDDWSRDFTTNHAATSAGAKNPSLHPITSAKPPAELVNLVETAAKKLRGWAVVTQEASHNETTLRLVRTTRLMRFKDDITVHIRSDNNSSPPVSCEISAESQSRIGKGDFGQNPRNLAELMDTIRSLLP